MTQPLEAQAPPRWLVANPWTNPEDDGRYANVSLFPAHDAEEAWRAVDAANERYIDSRVHRTWTIDLLNPEQVKPVSEFFAEIDEAMEDIA